MTLRVRFEIYDSTYIPVWTYCFLIHLNMTFICVDLTRCQLCNRVELNLLSISVSPSRECVSATMNYSEFDEFSTGEFIV